MSPRTGIIRFMAEKNRPVDSRSQTSSAELERLAALGRFTVKIAHELNNPLDGILRYINLADRSIELGNTEKLTEYLGQSRSGLLRMVRIVSELLEFSRSRYTPMDEPVAIEQVIEEAIKNTCGRADAPEVEIIRNFTADLPKVRAANLYQVFCNLIKNAMDSMPEGGALEITTTIERSGQIVIELRDSGCGFDPANAEAIFEPFFTTKTQGRGTGLGLAICKDLMARHGGHVSAENHPDRGSIFTVYLPKQGENKK